MRVPRSLIVLLFLVGAGLPRRAIAQGPADRPGIDSILTALANASDPQQLPPDSRCATYRGSIQRLCQGLIAVRRAEFTARQADAIRGSDLLERTVQEEWNWPVAWYGLGMARLELARLGVFPKEGPLLPTGIHYVGGANNALLRALELDSTQLGAAEALAMAPIMKRGVPRLDDRVTFLRRLRTELPFSPAARLAAALVERELGSVDTAVVMLDEALAHGADSGVAYLELARIEYMRGNTNRALSTYFAGAARARTPLARSRYRSELAWLASPAELRTWDTLPDTARGTWFQLFWDQRDVREGRKPGERVEEHFRRWNYAYQHYRIMLPWDGVHRTRVQSMTVDRINLALPGDPMVSMISPDAQVQVGGDLPSTDDIDAGQLVGALAPFKEFRIMQDRFDDRGLVYIRHGAPDDKLETAGGTAIEAWKYHRDGEPDLVLFFGEADFDGIAGASVLIPSPIGAGATAVNQLCTVQPGFCDNLIKFAASTPGALPGSGGGLIRAPGQRGATMTPALQQPTPAQMVVDRDRGIAQMTRAATTDAYPRWFRSPVLPLVQAYGLDRAGGGAPRLVVAFAIPGEQISPVGPPDANGAVGYLINLHLIALDLASARRFDIDTTRGFRTTHPLETGEFLSGMTELPLPAGSYEVTLVVGQPDSRGGLARFARIDVPGRGTITLSDLVLGRDGAGLHWNSGATEVALNPLNTFTVGSSGELYYQLGGLSPGTSYETTLELFQGSDLARKPRVSLTFRETAGQSRLELQRRLDFNHLDQGSYLLRVTVRGGPAPVVATTHLILTPRAK